jgi:hypothetical protein
MPFESDCNYHAAKVSRMMQQGLPLAGWRNSQQFATRIAFARFDPHRVDKAVLWTAQLGSADRRN